MADSRCPKYVREGFNELLKWAQYGHEGIDRCGFSRT